MAKYRNREVIVMEELPNEQVRIEHTEPGTAGSEIVPKAQVYLSKDERKVVEDRRKTAVSTNDFRNIGDQDPVPVPSVGEVKVQRMAEDNLKRAEEQKKENEEWLKKNPKSDLTQKQQLDSIKVVPYRDEVQTKVADDKARPDYNKTGFTSPSKVK